MVPPCHPAHHRSRWPDLVRWRNRARMQRRLFVWFVVSAVTGVVDRLRGPSARAQWDNVQSLIGAQAARVWADPHERDAWASELAQQLGWAVRLDDASGNELARFGPSAMRWSATAPVLRAGARVGTVRVQPPKSRPIPAVSPETKLRRVCGVV